MRMDTLQFRLGLLVTLLPDIVKIFQVIDDLALTVGAQAMLLGVRTNVVDILQMECSNTFPSTRHF